MRTKRKGGNTHGLTYKSKYKYHVVELATLLTTKVHFKL